MHTFPVRSAVVTLITLFVLNQYHFLNQVIDIYIYIYKMHYRINDCSYTMSESATDALSLQIERCPSQHYNVFMWWLNEAKKRFVKEDELIAHLNDFFDNGGIDKAYRLAAGQGLCFVSQRPIMLTREEREKFIIPCQFYTGIVSMETQ
jgi:hypothetical protein